ncbi:intraflagellar transport protein 20 homolog isoform X2 [Vespa velutina]|uniref:intraflagellar transport protein 20 homolog isoform X2 n=1 Tax=Vespa velutina TaxID=202808 RepID=UPI001FB4B295|nr:intraflagellar transport protein 20 homolog isoform X2 [Vespa velutina]
MRIIRKPNNTRLFFVLSFKRRRRMADSLTKYGLYIDDLRIVEFQKNCNKFIDLTDNWANEVEKEKMRTIGARNLLRSVEKQRDAQKQQMQALIMEKSMELERLRIQYDSLKKIEMEQMETIEHLTVN